jgi:hypothetical protein
MVPLADSGRCQFRHRSKSGNAEANARDSMIEAKTNGKADVANYKPAVRWRFVESPLPRSKEAEVSGTRRAHPSAWIECDRMPTAPDTNKKTLVVPTAQTLNGSTSDAE